MHRPALKFYFCKKLSQNTVRLPDSTLVAKKATRKKMGCALFFVGDCSL